MSEPSLKSSGCSTHCGKNKSYFLLGNLDHFRINFATFSDCFRNVWGAFFRLFQIVFGYFCEVFAAFSLVFSASSMSRSLFSSPLLSLSSGGLRPDPAAEKIIWPFLFCIRLGNLGKTEPGKLFRNFKWLRIARMAPISTIFGPNESQRCQLKFLAVEKISAGAKTSKKVVPCSVSGEKQNRNGHIPEMNLSYLEACCSVRCK